MHWAVSPYSMELLVDLLKSPDLYVMQVEMDVYTLAKRVSHIVWLFSLYPPHTSLFFCVYIAKKSISFLQTGLQ